MTRTLVRRLAPWVVAPALVTAGGCVAEPTDPVAASHATLTGASSALREAGSATALFEVELAAPSGATLVRWQGTTRSRYGDQPASETEFAEFVVSEPGAGSRRIDVRQVAVGSVRYYRSPELDTPPGRPWAQLADGDYLTFGSDLANPNLGLADPHWYLELLTTVPPAAAFLADQDLEEEVDGVTAHRWSLFCQLPGEDCRYPDQTDPVARLFPGSHPAEITVWLDDAGRPIRLAATVHLSGVNDALTATMMFTGFGEPVEIVPPPPDQVTEWPP